MVKNAAPRVCVIFVSHFKDCCNRGTLSLLQAETLRCQNSPGRYNMEAYALGQKSLQQLFITQGLPCPSPLSVISRGTKDKSKSHRGVPSKLWNKRISGAVSFCINSLFLDSFLSFLKRQTQNCQETSWASVEMQWRLSLSTSSCQGKASVLWHPHRWGSV